MSSSTVHSSGCRATTKAVAAAMATAPATPIGSQGAGRVERMASVRRRAGSFQRTRPIGAARLAVPVPDDVSATRYQGSPSRGRSTTTVVARPLPPPAGSRATKRRARSSGSRKPFATMHSATHMVTWVSSAVVPMGPLRRPCRWWSSVRRPSHALIVSGDLPPGGRPSASPIAPPSSAPMKRVSAGGTGP